MNEVLLSCGGARVAGIAIPPFRLHRGDYICLHTPSLSLSKEEEQLATALSGELPVAGIHVSARVVWSDWHRFSPRGLGALLESFNRCWRRKPRAVDWVRRAALLSPLQAHSRIESLGLDPEAFFYGLKATNKVLLGIEAAWARGADTVIFSVVGLDTVGRSKVRETVARRLTSGGAIELCYEYWSLGQRHRDCFRGATCLSLESVPLAESVSSD